MSRKKSSPNDYLFTGKTSGADGADDLHGIPSSGAPRISRTFITVEVLDDDFTGAREALDDRLRRSPEPEPEPPADASGEKYTAITLRIKQRSRDLLNEIAIQQGAGMNDLINRIIDDYLADLLEIDKDLFTRDFYTTADVAGMLGVKELSVYRWIKEGQLTASKPGGRWHISKEALQIFLRTSKNHHPGDNRLLDALYGDHTPPADEDGRSTSGNQTAPPGIAETSGKDEKR